jgi:hypothetical protein
MDTGPYSPGEGDWAWCPMENRATNLFDASGKRIGFLIERSLDLRPGAYDPHVRWVSVTKDGDWLRNDLSTFHATWEEAEKAVERRIRRSIARYEALAKARGGPAADLTRTVGSTPTSPIARRTGIAGRTQSPSGEQGCLLVIAVAAGGLIAAFRCFAGQ